MRKLRIMMAHESQNGSSASHLLPGVPDVESFRQHSFQLLSGTIHGGVWVALEDIDSENGPLIYYPGSHALPIFTNEHVGVNPDTQSKSPTSHYPLYEQTWEALVESLELKPLEFHARCLPISTPGILARESRCGEGESRSVAALHYVRSPRRPAYSLISVTHVIGTTSCMLCVPAPDSR